MAEQFTAFFTPGSRRRICESGEYFGRENLNENIQHGALLKGFKLFVHFLLVLLKMSDKIHKLCGWRIGGVVSMDRRVATMITRQAEKYKDNCLWFERDVDWSTT
jgi:hypothetical protein